MVESVLTSDPTTLEEKIHQIMEEMGGVAEYEKVRFRLVRTGGAYLLGEDPRDALDRAIDVGQLLFDENTEILTLKK